jgi:o-succinylbenzoate---CoA ligase
VDYPFSSILLNGREVPILSILEGSELGRNAFEENALLFIRDWLQGVDTFFIETSGSTGIPKRIEIERWQMLESARATAQALQLQRGKKALLCLDPAFIAGKMMLVRSLEVGMGIQAVTPSANPLANLEWGNPIHFVAIVPYQLHGMLDSADAGKLNLLENVIIGGAAIPLALQDRLEDYPGAFYATYGMTETISHIALQRLNGPSRSSEYHVLPGIGIATDERSCLIVDCPYTSGVVVTNDVVTLTSESTFEFVGRADNVINTGGVKLFPEQIEKKLENLLNRLNLHLRFAISALPDPRLGEKAVLVIETESLEKSKEDEILDFLRDQLPKFERPKGVFAVFPFPITATGKLDRRNLKQFLTEQQFK